MLFILFLNGLSLLDWQLDAAGSSQCHWYDDLPHCVATPHQTTPIRPCFATTFPEDRRQQASLSLRKVHPGYQESIPHDVLYAATRYRHLGIARLQSLRQFPKVGKCPSFVGCISQHHRLPPQQHGDQSESLKIFKHLNWPYWTYFTF